MLKSPPPRPARPKAPHGMSFMQIPCHVIHGHDATVMARHPGFRHDMSYMDMPWSWHVMPCSHLMWPWHDKLHMKQVMLPTHVQPFISWRLVSKLLSVSKSWPPLSPCGENVKRWNLQWHWTLPHVWVLLPSTALFGQLPSHLGAIKLWGPIPPSRFLQFSSLLSWSLADQGTHLSSLAFLRGPDSGLVLMLHEFGTPMAGMQVHGGKRNHDSNMTHMGNMANKHEYPRSLTWQAWQNSMDDKHETPCVASMGWPIGLPQLASIIPSSAWACEHGTRLPAGCWTFSIQSGLSSGLYPGWRMEFGSPSPRWTPKGDSVKGTTPKRWDMVFNASMTAGSSFSFLPMLV